MNKTLVLSENFPPRSGGSGRWFWELYTRLPTEQYVIAADGSSQAEEFDRSSPLKIYRLPLSSPEWGVKSWTGFRFYWRCFFKLKALIKQEGVTQIHAGRVIHEGVTAWLLRLFTRTPYLCFIHGEDVETAATSREHDLLVRQVCRLASLLICNSQNTASIVKRLGYATDEKIRVLHPGVDAERFVPAPVDEQFRREMGWDDKLVVLTAGRLQQRKGQDKMIEALPLVLEKHPNALYVIVGDGECLGLLKALVDKHGLQEHVQFLREIPDQTLIQCYQQCDLFILPNRTIDNDIEGFGMVLVEAQACAKPVIAGDSGGTRETMIVGETGLVVDCTTPSRIAEAVISLLSDPDKRLEMGQKGRHHVEENLDWKAHATRARALFEEVKA